MLFKQHNQTSPELPKSKQWEVSITLSIVPWIPLINLKEQRQIQRIRKNISCGRTNIPYTQPREGTFNPCFTTSILISSLPPLHLLSFIIYPDYHFSQIFKSC